MLIDLNSFSVAAAQRSFEAGRSKAVARPSTTVALFCSSENAMHDNLAGDVADQAQVRPGETMLRMCEEDYLRWEPRMRLKHEFVNGQVYLWPGYELGRGDELREELDGQLYVWTRWR